MRLLLQLLALVSCAALLVTSFVTVPHATTFGHDTFYRLGPVWMRQVWQWSLFSTLVLSFVLVKAAPLFARLGIVATVVALMVRTVISHIIQPSLFPHT